jgi:hypothetical protein
MNALLPSMLSFMLKITAAFNKNVSSQARHSERKQNLYGGKKVNAHSLKADICLFPQ